jgi:hypothetical protein
VARFVSQVIVKMLEEVSQPNAVISMRGDASDITASAKDLDDAHV